jgi:parallel beta-helix repeat protein
MAAYVDETPVEFGVEGVPAGGSKVATASIRLSGGTHSIRVRVDPGGAVEELDENNNEASAVVTVSPNIPPEARFTYSPGSPTTEADVAFTDASTDKDGRIVRWYWSFGDGTSSSLQNPRHRYTSAGTYTVTLTVTDDRGDTGSCSGSLTVTSPPPPPPPAKTNTSLSITPLSFSLGPGKSLSLTATLRDANSNPLSGKTVSWSATAGSLSSQSGVTNSSGQVTVTYTAPAVSVRTPVTLAASFSGDSSYNASSENASGAVLITICIEGDDNFTALNGVNGGGDGSAGNPYVIENWKIDASENIGIHIKDTRKHFLIRNCLVENGGSNYHGIYLENARNARVENSVVENCHYGIYSSESAGIALRNNTCSNNAHSGIYLYFLGTLENVVLENNTCDNNYYGIFVDCDSLPNAVVNNNRCRNNQSHGIYLKNSINSILENNTCNSNNDCGIYLWPAAGDNLKNNTCNNNSTGIYLRYSSNNYLENNSARNNSSSGIRIQAGDEPADNNVISNNTVENSYEGIYLYHSKNNLIENNICDNNTLNGIILDYSDHNNLENNTCNYNTDPGIYLYHSSNNTLTKNTCNHNDAPGIKLFSSPNNSLDNNVCEYNSSGIDVASSSFVSLVNNRCSYNSNSGIIISGSDNDNIDNNTIENNMYGIYVYSSSDNNKIINNRIENSTNFDIYLKDSTYNTLRANTYDNNKSYGIPAISGVSASPGPTTATITWITVNNSTSFVEYGIAPDNYELEDSFGGTTKSHSVELSGLSPNKTYSYRAKSTDENHNTEISFGYTFDTTGGAFYHDPISISGDDEFTEANGVTSGAGTEDDPYIIENWVISASTAHGIHIKDTTKHFVIRYVLVENAPADNAGIMLDNVINGRIENSRVDNCYYGIYLYSSDNNKLENNIVAAISSEGIFLDDSDNCKLFGNTVNNNGTGIFLYGSDCSVTGNIVENCTYGLYIVDSVNDNFSGNALALNTYNLRIYGEESSHFVHNIEATNTVNGRPVIYLVGENGIVVNQDNVIGYLGLVQCNNVLVENLILENNGQGILLAYTENSVIENVVCRNNELGTYLFGCINVSFENSTVGNNSIGIFLKISDNNTIRNTRVENVSYAGISLYSSDKNTLDNNIVRNSPQHGIYISREIEEDPISDNNEIRNSTVENCFHGIYIHVSENHNIFNNTVENNYYGIYLDFSYYNTIHHNLIYNNHHNAYCLGGAYNAWDNGSEGNWWGDWQWEHAVDADNDGIFENRRQITGGTTTYDNHPLSLVNLKTPDNGASVGSPVTLQWTAPALPVYVVQVDNNSDFGSIEYENTINVSIDSFDLSRTVETQATLGAGTWYWKVKVKDNEGREVAVSPVRCFTVS